MGWLTPSCCEQRSTRRSARNPFLRGHCRARMGSSSIVTSEVFSTDWSFESGQDKRDGCDGADPLRTQADPVEGPPAGLEQGDASLAGRASAADELVAGGVVRVQVAALGGGQYAGTGAVVARVGQRR